MKKVISLLFFIVIIIKAQAQFQVSGTIQDTLSEPLSFASIVILNASDSTVKAFGLSNAKGRYQIDLEEKGDYLIQYSFLGYQTRIEPLKTDWKSKKIELVSIQMRNSSVQLNEVEIAAERIPMKMKGDTLVYDAKAFTTRDGDNVEKLIEKLPGVEVDEDGNITAQGKTVSKILVNGKEFFGDNLQMATKNIEAKAVKNVEVLDKKSDEAEFTGVDDGSEERTINLELEEEYSKGYFGRLFAAAGTEDTYQGSYNYNQFNKKSQFSVIGGGNNLNEQNFDFSEYLDFQGGNGGGSFNNNAVGFNQNDGINENFSTGVNLNHEINDQLEFNGNYFYVRKENELEKIISSSNFTPDTTFESNEDVNNRSKDQNHSTNMRMEWEVDSMTDLDIRFDGSISDGKRSNISKTIFGQDEGNTTSSSNINEQENWRVNTEIDLRRKFEKKGRNIIGQYDFSYSNEDQINDLENIVFGRPIDQLQDFNTVNEQHKASVKYTEPLSKDWYASLTYSINSQNNEPERLFFDRFNETQVINDSLSGAFEREVTDQRVTLEIKKSVKSLTYSFGAAASDIEVGTNLGTRSFNFIYPFANLRYRLKGSKSLRLSYNTSTAIPNLNQLLTIPNNVNPNQNYVGNENLDPEYTHRVSISYHAFDPLNKSSYYLSVNASTTDDKIVNRTIVNSDFTRLVTPQNTDFYQSVGSYAGTSQRIKKLNIKYRLNARVNYSKYDVFLNDALTQVGNQDYRLGLRIGRDKSEKWDLDFGFNYTINRQEYDLNDDFDSNFDNFSYYVDGELQITQNLLLEARYTIQTFTNAFFAESRTLDLVNVSLRQSMFNERWSIILAANDLLNERIGIRRSGDINSLREEVYNTRARYFMLGLSKKIGKRKDPPRKGGRYHYRRSR